jgi:hypothetical protein
MPRDQRCVTPADLVSPSQFAKERHGRRRALLPAKRLRRVEVGPHATFHFENFDTMLFQIQEMLYLARNGPSRVDDELRSYNPLIPQGEELIATIMFEIDDPQRRTTILARLRGVETTFFLQVDSERVHGAPMQNAPAAADPAGAAPVYFVRFNLTPAQRAHFTNAVVMVGADHPDYAHLAILTAAARAELAGDFE